MVARNPATETTVFLWNDATDDLLDSALAVRLTSRESALVEAINLAISELAESSTGAAVAAETILRDAKRALGVL